jgi:hypothetical protein
VVWGFSSSLWLKFVPGWPAISVSTLQQLRLGQNVWFGWLSAIPQLASRVGEGGGVGRYTTFLYLAQVARAGGGGLRSLPLLTINSSKS